LNTARAHLKTAFERGGQVAANLRATLATILKCVPNPALGLRATSSNEVEIASAHRSRFAARQAHSDSLQLTQSFTLASASRPLEIM